MKQNLLASTILRSRPTMRVRLDRDDDMFDPSFVQAATIFRNLGYEIELQDETGTYEMTITERDT